MRGPIGDNHARISALSAVVGMFTRHAVPLLENFVLLELLVVVGESIASSTWERDISWLVVIS